MVKTSSVGLLCAIATLVACTSSSPAQTGPGDAATADGGVVSCEMDPRVDAFDANLTKKSASGALTATLVTANPAPPALRNNTWTVKLTDASGASITGATLSVVPFMPDHGHGTSIVPQITPGADGSYQIDPLYLFMPGVWRISIGVMPDGGAPAPADVVELFFCVEG